MIAQAAKVLSCPSSCHILDTSSVSTLERDLQVTQGHSSNFSLGHGPAYGRDHQASPAEGH